MWGYFTVSHNTAFLDPLGTRILLERNAATGNYSRRAWPEGPAIVLYTQP